jgi:chemotaxis response regulator CheB
VDLAVSRTAVVAFGALALALTGCGRDGDRQAVRAVASGFYAAVQDHHGARACALLSVDTRKALEQQESEPCAKAVEKLSLHPGRPAAAEVYSTEASVHLAGGDTVLLGDTAQGWRISAAGCQLHGPSQPADCELQD